MCSIVLAFVPYFWIVFRFPMAFVGVFVLAVVVLVALLVAFHVVNAMATASIRNTGDVPSPDELDRLIELRAAKLSGSAQSAGPARRRRTGGAAGTRPQHGRPAARPS